VINPFGRRASLQLAAATVVVSIAHLAAQSPAAGDQKMSREWRRLSAPGLTVMGNTRGSDLRQTAEEITRFHLVMRTLVPALRTDPPAPVVAVVFRDDNALTPFKPRDRGKPMDTVAAYFTALPDVNYIVMAIGRREFTYRVIFHEYTHLLVHQNIRRLPLWLDEGLADFFSTFDGSERDGRLIVGRPIPEYVSLLGGLGTVVPLNKFIDQKSLGNLYRDHEATSRFYAQSWALTHYLMLGDNMSHRPQLAAFMAGVQSGDAPDVVFRRVFGDDLGPLERALRQYVNLMKLPAFQLTPPELRIDAEASSLTEADAEQLQGDLLVRTGALEEADKHLAASLALDRMNIPARLSRARSLIAQDRAADALDVLSAPDLLARNDFPTVFLRAEANRTTGHFAAAEEAYRRATELRPDFAFVSYGMSITQMALGRPEAAATFDRVLLLQPGAGWYFSRLQESQRLGIDTFVQSDASHYVDLSGWNGSTPYVMFIAALTHRRQHSAEKAAEVLEAIRSHVTPESWQAMVTSFLQDKLTADGLLAKASPEALLTEAHAYIGIKASIDGDRDTALKHLQWVKDKGRHDYTEYRLALGELDRLERASKAVVQ
jgi:tetratricopeptide (TPR) repeat protein